MYIVTDLYTTSEFGQYEVPYGADFTSGLFLRCFKCRLRWNRIIVFLYTRYYCARTKNLCKGKNCFIFGSVCLKLPVPSSK